MKMKKVAHRKPGEIACRIVRRLPKTRSCQRRKFHPQIEATALHVDMAEEAVLIEAAKAGGQLSVQQCNRRGRGYRRAPDAIHPGYGFLSENAKFARGGGASRAESLSAPARKTTAAMGRTKRVARAIAENAGVPVLPGSPRFEQDALDGLEAAGDAVGFPLLVKASGGGGGIGKARHRQARNPANRRGISTQSIGVPARSANGAIFLERYIRPVKALAIFFD